MPWLLGAFPDGLVVVDAQGRILQANAQAVALFRRGDASLAGTPIQALFPGQQPPYTGEGSRRRHHGDRCLHLEGSRGDSSRFRAAVAVMPVEMDNGAAAVLCIRDLTEVQETQFILERGLEILSTVIAPG